jgi:hypothetical protein
MHDLSGSCHCGNVEFTLFTEIERRRFGAAQVFLVIP